MLGFLLIAFKHITQSLWLSSEVMLQCTRIPVYKCGIWASGGVGNENGRTGAWHQVFCPHSEARTEPLCSLGGQQPDWSARPFPHGTDLYGGGVSASLMFFVFLPPPLSPLVCAHEMRAAVKRLFLGLNDSSCHSFLPNIFFSVTMSCLLRTLRFWGKYLHGYGFCSRKCPSVKCKR